MTRVLVSFLMGAPELTEAQLNAAVEACLEEARRSERPFLQISSFLVARRAEPEFTDADLVKIQTRVVRELIGNDGINR